MYPGDDGDYRAWFASVSALTSTEAKARAWRERRFRFAHALGASLVAGDRPVAGPVVYGVWLPWGLLYVGQTSHAERRLRDLAVGESHHLANTFPAETWRRVGLVMWPELSTAEEVIGQLGAETVGLALEHRLQVLAQPLANAARRTRAGGWRAVDRVRSRSRGAVAAAEVEALFDDVRGCWTRLESDPSAACHEGPVLWVSPSDMSRD